MFKIIQIAKNWNAFHGSNPRFGYITIFQCKRKPLHEAVLVVIRHLGSNNDFEQRTSTRSGLFALFGSDFQQILSKSSL